MLLTSKSIVPIFNNSFRKADFRLRHDVFPLETVLNAMRFLIRHKVSTLRSIKINTDPPFIQSYIQDLWPLVLELVSLQQSLLSFSIYHLYRPLPDQSLYFTKLGLAPHIASLTSLRLNSNHSFSHSLEILKRTPNLIDLSLDESYSDTTGLVQQIPELVPHLKALRVGGLGFQSLEPLSRLPALATLVVAMRVDLGSLEVALKHLPAKLAVNVCFGTTARENPEGDCQCFLTESFRGRDFDLARRLIDLGAQVGRVGDSNMPMWRMSPLHDAAFTGNEKAIRLLLDAGASVLCTSYSSNALQYALEMSSSANVIRMILESAASNVKENYAAFLLPNGGCIYESAARERGCEDALEICLSVCHKFLDVNFRNFYQFPPIAFAYSAKRVDTFLSYGADPNLPVAPFPTLLEAMLCSPDFHSSARANALHLVTSGKCRQRLNLDASAVERIFEADSRRSQSWINATTSPVLEFLFELYPATKLEDLLQRINFWDRLQAMANSGGP